MNVAALEVFNQLRLQHFGIGHLSNTNGHGGNLGKLRGDVLPGKVTSLQLTADKAGSFTFVCDIFCGSGHEDMSGTLVVAGGSL